MLQDYYVDSNVLGFIGKVMPEKLEEPLKKSNLKKDIYIDMEEKLWLYSEDDIKLLQIFYLEISRIKININKMK